MGKNIDNNKIIEGQMLSRNRDSNYEFLIRYIVNNKDFITINFLRLEGFDLVRSTASKNSYTDLESIYNHKYVNINQKPYIQPYKGDKTYIYSSDEAKILSLYKPSTKNNIEYKCFGKNAINKHICESVYDKTGNKNKKVGVWDRLCVKDSECPFYKSNKNYENTFGGCKNGYCEVPIGVKQISPRKYIDNNTSICYQCNKGINCCERQKDKKAYPNLLSPDYNFKNDKNIRQKNDMPIY